MASIVCGTVTDMRSGAFELLPEAVTGTGLAAG
jgi:hypothetical protein